MSQPPSEGAAERTQAPAAEQSTGQADPRFVPWLLLLTGVSGLVDAASYLRLGHVFVANMTGNIVFVGFALAGASGLSPASSGLAVVAFAAGALVAGRITRIRSWENRHLLAAMSGAEFVLVLLAIGLGVLVTPRNGLGVYGIVFLLAGAMGLQSATTSRLAVPGFNSTVVLTTMLGTLAASSRLAGGRGAENGRRFLAIGSMLSGGLVGALLTLRVTRLVTLGLAALILGLSPPG